MKKILILVLGIFQDCIDLAASYTKNPGHFRHCQGLSLINRIPCTVRLIAIVILMAVPVIKRFFRNPHPVIHRDNRQVLAPDQLISALLTDAEHLADVPRRI
jgi:hypothetical protein